MENKYKLIHFSESHPDEMEADTLHDLKHLFAYHMYDILIRQYEDMGVEPKVPIPGPSELVQMSYEDLMKLGEVHDWQCDSTVAIISDGKLLWRISRITGKKPWERYHPGAELIHAYAVWPNGTTNLSEED